MKRVCRFVAGLFVGTFVLAAQLAGAGVLISSSQTPSSNEASILSTPPIPADQAPRAGTFYSAKLGDKSPPMPSNMGLPVWNLGNGSFLIDDLNADTGEALATGTRSMMAMSGPPTPGGGGGTNGGGSVTNVFSYTFPTNELWIELTSRTNGWVYGKLHNATNTVYVILSNTNLSGHTWTPEQEIFPGTSTTVVPFGFAGLNQPMLFLQVRDWTGVTHGGNVTPDWWFWYYFGTTNLSDSTLDSSGNTLGYDYQYSINPNQISFSISVTNDHVRGTVPVHLNIASGSPNYYAVSIDNTNNPTWLPYPGPNFSVSLTSEGWHNVYVGLCGSESGIVTWQARRVRADLTPPTLAVTSPSGTVEVPLIQLCGTASKQLASISLDINNSTGLKINQTVVITGQTYNTNTTEYTTSNWQCYDLPLASGANQITIHATDLAGNPATLTTTITCTGRTRPPSMTLLWPQNGMRVNGNSITIKGQVDDRTASVSVSSVDAEGNTNVYTGITGRDGVFWIENVPLSASNNVFTLTAANAAGQSSANFTLTPSTVSLTINPMQAGGTTASGTLGASGYTVWVNGVKATLNGSTWSATIAPITIGGGQVQVTAIPNTDNGGNGSGGSGNSNPSSTQSLNAQTTVQPPSDTYQSGFHYYWQASVPQWDGSTSTTTTIMDWEDGQGGHYRNWYNSTLSDDDTYPATFWPQSHGDLPLMNTISVLQANYSGPIGVGSGTCVETANSTVKLATGGPLGSKVQRLWGLGASRVYLQDPYNGGTPPSDEDTIANFGNWIQGTSLWTILPDNSIIDVTPRASGDINKFLVGAAPYDIVIMANGIALDPNSVAANANFCVGQNVSFSLSGFPDGVTATNFQWTLDGNFVNEIIPASNTNSSTTYTNDASLLKCAELPNIWWTSGGSPALTYTANLTCTLVFANGNSNRTFSVSGKFTMYRPTATIQFQPPFVVCLGSIDGALAVQLGKPNGGNDTTNGMKFVVTITSTVDGMGAITQKINARRANGNTSDTTSGSYALDTTTPYVSSPIRSYTPTLILYDAPGYPCAHSLIGGNITSVVDYFTDYIQFRPDAGNANIYVTLGTTSWSWSGTSTYSNGQWSDPGPNSIVTPPSALAPSEEFPTWTDVFPH